ncbi:Crp/Fnr family transcriptional regulator [Myxosarcina sp. GI1]|uniref:Crp/Fnr family transcriptional regulator n=1 Tax=Myxosarcina sp. GI1 TaxID=1541065 RepID=UPI00055C431F|nr:Crp/Fnr family transcriptional regulator [Myxosarcina sp. GI1]
MPLSPINNIPTNRILSALPQKVYQRLARDLQPVELPQHRIIYYAGDNYNYAYFPTDSIVSTVAIMENGSTTEIGVIGNEGMVGLPIVLNSDRTNSTAIVQVGGNGYKIEAKKLRKEIERNEELKHILMRYVQARIIELGQIAACNRYHNIERRFARWMLTVGDRIEKLEFNLTQEFISQMLGVRRAGVTQVANKFQKQGIIQYKRGFIQIISQSELEARTCECYRLIANHFERLIMP